MNPPEPFFVDTASDKSLIPANSSSVMFDKGETYSSVNLVKGNDRNEQIYR